MDQPLANLKFEKQDHSSILNQILKKFSVSSSTLKIVTGEGLVTLPESFKMYSPVLFEILKDPSSISSSDLTIIIPDGNGETIKNLYELVTLGYMKTVQPVNNPSGKDDKYKYNLKTDIVELGKQFGLRFDHESLFYDEMIPANDKTDSLYGKLTPKHALRKFKLDIQKELLPSKKLLVADQTLKENMGIKVASFANVSLTSPTEKASISSDVKISDVRTVIDNETKEIAKARPTLKNEFREDSYCFRCRHQFSSPSFLAFHVKSVHVHEEKNIYPCDKCDFKTSSTYALSRHKGNYHGKGKLKCDTCEYSSNRKDHMIRHMKAIHGKEYDS